MPVQTNQRHTEHDIHPLFLERWSPRAFTGAALSRPALLQLLEAARWAPSGYNVQPWRFIYALRDTPAFDTLLEPLVPFNQSWARQAGALVFIVSKERFLPPGGEAEVVSHSHSFDAGAAWAALALQATHAGLQAHGMTGLDFARAAEVLGVPEGYRVEAAVAIGTPGDKSLLPEGLQAREVPSQRKPLEEIAAEGRFSEQW